MVCHFITNTRHANLIKETGPALTIRDKDSLNVTTRVKDRTASKVAETTMVEAEAGTKEADTVRTQIHKWIGGV